MTKSNLVKREILKILFSASNRTLHAYTLNKRVSIPTNTFFELVNQLAVDELVLIDGVFVKLSEVGVKILLSQLDIESKSKNSIPARFLSEVKVEVNDFYVPKRSLL